ncbi:MAG: hypothetical protein K5846_07545 [Bacteroidales bacterium]|nr:hypothetical protein [Bacteroidales bacterium]
MDTTTNIENLESRKPKRMLSTMKSVFGGEFLLSRQMRPWYLYILFVLALVTALVVSEQSISNKKKKVARLESSYRQEVSKLKANNQYIPYEENKILIQKLLDRGYVFDNNQNFTIRMPKPADTRKRHFFKKRDKKHADNPEE